MKNNSFHEKAREALKKHLENMLSSCVIDKGIVNFDRSKDEDLYKYINEAKKHKKTWMRDIDLYGLLYEEVSNYLARHVEKPWEATGILKDLIVGKEIGEITDVIIAHLESIPRKYRIYFELPSVKGIGVKEIRITDDISFVEKINEGDFKEVKIPSRSLLGGNCYTLQREKLYICLQVNGYADGTLESSAVKKAYSKFRQVILLGKLSGVFVEKKRTISAEFLSFGVPHVFVIHELDINGEIYQVTLSKAVLDYLSKIELNENTLKPTALELLLETFENRETFTSNDKAKILQKRFQHPVNLLKTPDNDKNAEPLKTAIEWAFDSLTNDNDTLAFIQACIGLEAIMGDDETKDNITATLADRCSYLLGDSISARKRIREDFKKFYCIRSKVVHGRKAYLDDEQRHFLNYAQIILKQVIWKEVSYIKEGG